MYSLRLDPLGFLPVPFLGSFLGFLPSVKKLYIWSTSSSFNSLGNNGFNLSIDILDAFLAAVPDAPPFVTTVSTLKLG